MSVLKIEGMSCGHCKARVEKALSEVAGVNKAEVDLANKQASVEGDASVQDLVKAVSQAGYTVTSVE
jgi:copper chaperone CopZ